MARSFLAEAERRHAAAIFPYMRQHWGWRAGLSSDPAAAQAQALANETLAMEQAEQAARMASDLTEAACYRSPDWRDAMHAWTESAAFWRAVAAEAAALIPAMQEAA